MQRILSKLSSFKSPSKNSFLNLHRWSSVNPYLYAPRKIEVWNSFPGKTINEQMIIIQDYMAFIKKIQFKTRGQWATSLT